jgi:RNA polymerase sigma-70 factor (ECF subfamily)
VLNACRDFSRRRTSAQRLVANYGALRAMDEADEADSQDRSAWLHTALAELDPALRETVLLVIAEDLSHGEAAKVLGCAEKTVSWRMHEAKKRLRARKSEAHE